MNAERGVPSTRDVERRLPVPALWQAAVLTAIDAACVGHSASPDEVAVARVEEVNGIDGLDVWLVVGGRTAAYRVSGGEASRLPAF